MYAEYNIHSQQTQSFARNDDDDYGTPINTSSMYIIVTVGMHTSCNVLISYYI